MKIFNLKKINETKKGTIFQEAAQTLLSGNLLLAPTETVFGIFCTDKEKIYKAKKRPNTDPLQMVGSKESFLNIIAQASPTATIASFLGKCFWPGSLSIITDTKIGKQCLRVPAYQPLLTVLNQVNTTVFASSLNLHGSPTLQNEQEIKTFMNNSGLEMLALLDDVTCGKPSTIIELSFEPESEFVKMKFLRVGAIPVAEVINCIYQKYPSAQNLSTEEWIIS